MAGRRAPSVTALARLGLRAAGVAHDLAQPLTAALLAAKRVDGNGARPLREALGRMETLLQHMRAELRPETAAESPRAVDLAQVRRTLLADLTPAERRRTRIRLAGVATGDAVVLQRILGNLVTNALRHSQGPVRVEGSTRGRNLTLTVEGGAANRPARQGWGVGLAACQELARRHGLALRLTLSPGGSKATLRNRT